MEHRYIAAFGLTLLALCAIGARAATGPTAITLTRPTTYVDGSALPSSAITGYAVSCTFTPPGGTASACTLTGSPLPGGTATGGNVTLTYPASGGQACFSLKTLVGSVSSAGTSPVCKTLDGIAPSDPTNVTITITLAVNIASSSPVRVAVADPVVTRQ